MGFGCSQPTYTQVAADFAFTGDQMRSFAAWCGNIFHIRLLRSPTCYAMCCSVWFLLQTSPAHQELGVTCLICLPCCSAWRLDAGEPCVFFAVSVWSHGPSKPINCLAAAHPPSFTQSFFRFDVVFQLRGLMLPFSFSFGWAHAWFHRFVAISLGGEGQVTEQVSRNGEMGWRTYLANHLGLCPAHGLEKHPATGHNLYGLSLGKAWMRFVGVSSWARHHFSSSIVVVVGPHFGRVGPFAPIGGPVVPKMAHSLEKASLYVTDFMCFPHWGAHAGVLVPLRSGGGPPELSPAKGAMLSSIHVLVPPN